MSFVLHLLLTQVRLRGYFLPPRPQRNAVEGQLMADSFIEERRTGLERYLQRLVEHEAVMRSEVRVVCVCVHSYSMPVCVSSQQERAAQWKEMCFSVLVVAHCLESCPLRTGAATVPESRGRFGEQCSVECNQACAICWHHGWDSKAFKTAART